MLLVSVVFVIKCLYSTVSLTLVREKHFIRIIYYYYHYSSGSQQTWVNKVLIVCGCLCGCFLTDNNNRILVDQAPLSK